MNYSSRSSREAPTTTPIAKRVVLVVVDGLRPDAIERFGLSNLARIANRGASTLTARSVSPCNTLACAASLMTGVSPSEHGIENGRLSYPRSSNRLATLPNSIAAEGFQVAAFMGDVPMTIRGSATLIGKELGFQSVSFRGHTSAEILSSALHALCSQRRGLIALHFPDAAEAGGEYGWMSDSYGAAARRIDGSIGLLETLSGAAGGETLLVVVSGRGGGGEDPKRHVSDHPLDLTIPLMLAGRHIARCSLGKVSLLDIAPTILSALGLPIPRSYEGRVLSEAFERRMVRSVNPRMAPARYSLADPGMINPQSVL
jgi:arylsulfatase A-like enzyme